MTGGAVVFASRWCFSPTGDVRKVTPASPGAPTLSRGAGQGP